MIKLKAQKIWQFKDQLTQVHNEFIERDIQEKSGQSPNDLSSAKNDILEALKKI